LTETHPRSGDVYGNIGRVDEAGDKKLAAENFKKAIELFAQ
jgi:hypothetical protein